MFDPSNKEMQSIWHDFDPELAAWVARLFKYHGTDQSWISYKLHDRFPYVGHEEGAWGMAQIIRKFKGQLPSCVDGNYLCRLVFCYGKTKPWMVWAQELDWVHEAWR